MSVRIITTEDGSHSLLQEKLNETYHSTRGALGESTHVFIKEGLSHWLSKNNATSPKILEVGFGTGLNAFLTANYAEQQSLQISYETLEPYPVRSEIFQSLNYADSESSMQLLIDLHEVGWEQFQEVSTSFEIRKTTTTLENFESKRGFDMIYFDAFAPNKQPEVWSLDNLKKCFELLNNNGVLTTYCAQGQFKRNLAEAGFEVETLPGAMGKKEMVRANKR